MAKKYKLTNAEKSALLRDLRRIYRRDDGARIYEDFARARDKGRGPTLRRDREVFSRLEDREGLSANL
jgi:hypothetical protein